MSDHEFDVGEWAVAKPRQGVPDDEESIILVVGQANGTAGQVALYEEPNGTTHTVADYHDGKWADSPVVEVVYKEALERRVAQDNPAYTVGEILDLHEAGQLTRGAGSGGYGVRTYSFPEARLEPYDNE